MQHFKTGRHTNTACSCGLYISNEPSTITFSKYLSTQKFCQHILQSDLITLYLCITELQKYLYQSCILNLETPACDCSWIMKMSALPTWSSSKERSHMGIVRLCWIPERRDVILLSSQQRMNFFVSLLYVQSLGQNALAWSQGDSHFISQSWTAINLLTRIKSLFCRAISSMLLKAGCLEYAELLTDVIPLQNFANQSHVEVLFYVSSLKASFNFSQIL